MKVTVMKNPKRFTSGIEGSLINNYHPTNPLAEATGLNYNVGRSTSNPISTSTNISTSIPFGLCHVKISRERIKYRS